MISKILPKKKSTSKSRATKRIHIIRGCNFLYN